MVSIRDIAKACSVSTATVSKAINGASDISAATRERVCRMAEEMGYRPNAAARALKTKRSYNIGVLFKEEAGRGLTHEYFSAVLEGFKNEVEAQGFDVTFINTNDTSVSYYDHCRHRNVDGVAVVCGNFEDPRVIQLMNGIIPTITIDYVFNGKSAILSNNGQGISDLFRYVYGKGHRKIAYIHGAPSSVSNARLIGFYRAAEENGVTVPDEYIKAGVFHDSELCAKRTAELLDGEDPPTCIFFPDDFSAMGGIREIRQRGLRIPEDISVCGYDGILISKVMDPPLTTIHQETEEMGRSAAKLLIDQINHPKTTPVEIKTIESHLWEGGSVVSPSNRS